MQPSSSHIQSRVHYNPPEQNDNMAKLLLSSMRRHADRTLLVDTASRREWTGAQLLDYTGRVATNLVRQVGVKPDDVVFTTCDHTGDEVALAFSIVLAGCSLYGSGACDGYEEHKVLCQLVRPQVVVTCSRLHQQVLELRRTVEGMQDAAIIWIDDPTKEGVSGSGPNLNNNEDSSYHSELIKRDKVMLFDELAAGPIDLQLLDDVAEKRIRPEEHTLTYMLTSGSTGRPKVVPSTHQELMHGIQSMVSSTRYPVNGPSDGQQVPTDRLQMPFNEDSVLAGDLPLDHGAGVNTMFLSIFLGSKYIVMPSYQADSFWQAVHDYRITSSIASTTFTYKLMSRLKELIESGEAKRWDLSSFRLIYCAGAKMAYTDLSREICAYLPNLRIGQAYGATEIGFMALPCVGECADHMDSVGYLCPGLTAKIVDCDSEEPVGPNEHGELRVWANSKFKGYKCSPGDDSRALYDQCHDSEGFYRTGDQVHLDEDGRLYIHGRFKDTLVLMEDWKIMPAELEEVVDRHELVALSAVVGIPDPELPGCDAPRAFVRLVSAEDEASLSKLGDEYRNRLLARDLEWIAADVARFVAERTARPKHLRGGVHILNDFPRVGLLNKIDRKALRLVP